MKSSSPNATSSRSLREKRCGGMALLLTSVILMLVSMIAFSALRHSEQESTSAARSRNTMRTMYTADAGVQLALGRLAQSPPNLNAFDVTLDAGANLQSRTRTQTSPQDIGSKKPGKREEGYDFKDGTPMIYVGRNYLVNVTASYGTSTAEVEAKLSRMGPEITGY